MKLLWHTAWHAGLWQVLTRFVQAIQELFENSSSEVLLNSQLGEFFKTTVGVCQGYLLPLILFNLFIEKIMEETLLDSVTITHPSPLVAGPYATYKSPMTLI